MTEPLLIALSNTTGSIPLIITSNQQTNWIQFGVTLLISSVFVLYFLGNSFAGVIALVKVRLLLHSIRRKVGRPIVYLNQGTESFLTGKMITQNEVRKIQAALSKLKGKDFDLILHTPGGDVFSTIMVSKLLKNYPGRIRSVVPLWSMSGGTLLALSGDELVMSNIAALGQVDSQIGNFFKFGSAGAWRKVVSFKKAKAEDSSVAFDLMARQANDLIKGILLETRLLKSNMLKDKIVDFLVEGGKLHAHPLTIDVLRNIGLRVGLMSGEAQEQLSRLVCIDSGRSVWVVT